MSFHAGRANCSVTDRLMEVRITCSTVTSYVQSGTHVTILGTAMINGITTTYRIEADDLGDSGSGLDTFSIWTGDGYSASGMLTSGNIVVQGGP